MTTTWMIGFMDAASVAVWRAVFVRSVLVRLDRCSLHRTNIRHRCRRHHDKAGYGAPDVAATAAV